MMGIFQEKNKICQNLFRVQLNEKQLFSQFFFFGEVVGKKNFSFEKSLLNLYFSQFSQTNKFLKFFFFFSFEFLFEKK